MDFKALLTALLIALLAMSQTAQAVDASRARTDISGLRVGLTAGRTRLVFDLSGPNAYRLITLQNPARVVVDIPAATSSFDHRTVPLLGTPILRIRSAIQPDETLRYVFDVRGETQPTLFALKPFEDRGHRLVLDLHTTVDREETPLAIEPAPAAESPPEKPVLRKSATMSSRHATEIPAPPRSGSPGEWSGFLSLDTRLFFHGAEYPGQDDQNFSVAFTPEYYVDWANGTQRLAFSPFFRYDANDDERTHADIRELYWHMERGEFLVKAGVDVVFWGVAESRHLVDIINQTDLVENLDGEDKLGQPMFNLDYSSDWGTWQVYALPYFRERTFPGDSGRLRTDPAVDTDAAQYESGAGEQHIDFALRWSHYIGAWDIGLAHFSGTSREPWLMPSKDSQPALIPYYPQIDQTSVDAQATLGAWLWKLEAIYNDNKLEDYYAYTGGFEYTRFGIGGYEADLGLLLEYNYDQRGDTATSALQNDLFMALRWSGNDAAGTELLAGLVVDSDNQTSFGNLEASRRLGESWKVELELRLFLNVDPQDHLYDFRNDDYLEIRIARFY